VEKKICIRQTLTNVNVFSRTGTFVDTMRRSAA